MRTTAVFISSISTPLEFSKVVRSISINSTGVNSVSINGTVPLTDSTVEDTVTEKLEEDERRFRFSEKARHSTFEIFFKLEISL